MSMKFQGSNVDLSLFSNEQLQAMMKNKDLAHLIPVLQGELNERNKPKAVLTVELLKNSTVKPIGDTGMSRVQGTVVSAQLLNPGPQDEMTFGFGSNQGVAQIGVFLQIPDEELDKLNFSVSTHVTCEIALTVNPNGGHFALAAGTINELRSVYDAAAGRNRSLQVWKGPNGEEHIGKEGPEGYTQAKLPSYGNVTVVSIEEVNPVNLALTNSIVPEDPAAWLKEATAQVKISRDLNLNAYMMRQAASRDAMATSNSDIAAKAAVLETEDAAVGV